MLALPYGRSWESTRTDKIRDPNTYQLPPYCRAKNGLHWWPVHNMSQLLAKLYAYGTYQKRNNPESIPAYHSSVQLHHDRHAEFHGQRPEWSDRHADYDVCHWCSILENTSHTRLLIDGYPYLQTKFGSNLSIIIRFGLAGPEEIWKKNKN